jgi:hypothetical protein
MKQLRFHYGGLEVGGRRYAAKRAAGVPVARPDGSLTSPGTDREAACAEEYCAEAFGWPLDHEIFATTGDGARDFMLRADAKWLGAPGGVARLDGNLIINRGLKRYPTFYIVVMGVWPSYRMIGWTTHARLVARPLKDFGYGLKYNMPITDLWPMAWLLGEEDT